MRSIKPEDNLGLAVDAVRQLLPSMRGKPVSDTDEFQDACLGLVDAYNRFRPGKAEFSTYAYFWMRSHLYRGMGYRRGYKYHVQPLQFSQSPTFTREYDFVATDRLRPDCQPASAADEAVERERQNGQGPAGLLVQEGFRFLNEREREICERRLMKGESLDVASRKMGISKERVRQIQEIAMTKLYKYFRRRGIKNLNDLQEVLS